jgi:hypothetical protein
LSLLEIWKLRGREENCQPRAASRRIYTTPLLHLGAFDGRDGSYPGDCKPTLYKWSRVTSLHHFRHPALQSFSCS